MLHYLAQPKRRITTNLKTKNNQNCHKIELYGSLTTKELKKYSSRQEGRRWEAGVVMMPDKAVAGGLRYPTFTCR